MSDPFKRLRRGVTRHAFRMLNSMVVPAVKAGVGSPLPIGAGLVVLETTGRKSGLAREVPLVAVRVGSHVAVSTVRSGSLWIKNLEADPEASVWLCGRRRGARASVDSGPLSVASLKVS